MRTRKLFRHLIDRIDRQSVLWIAVAIMAISGFTVIASHVLSGDDLRVFDQSIIHYVHALSRPGLTAAMLIVTCFGSPVGITLISLVVVLALLAEGKPSQAGFLITSGVGAAILMNVAKVYFLRDRPTLFEPLVVEPGYSFPSGHVTVSNCLYGAIIVLVWSYCKPLWLRLVVSLLLLVLVALVSLSRIYLGVHYPSDTLGGFFLSMFWLSVCVVIFRPSKDVHSSFTKQVTSNENQTGP